MTDGLVMNRNGQAFLSAFDALEKRGAPEACLMIVDGEPGFGKSAFMLWWALETGSVYLRANTLWTPTWMLRDLLTALGESHAHRYETMFKRACTALAHRADEVARKQGSFAIVIDEIDHIARRSSMLETLRDLSDTLEIPFILVGMGRVRHHLVRFPQIASRVGQYVMFKPMSEEESIQLAEACLQTSADRSLIRFLHQVTGGRMREMKEGLKAIERFAARNQIKSITMKDMLGQPLLINRRTGKPVRVEAACPV